MKEIKTEIVIHASIDKISEILFDFAAYPEWNPFIRKIEGEVKENDFVQVTIQPPNKKPMSFRPKIITVQKQALIWSGDFLSPILFNGTHRFLLEAISANEVRFIQAEVFTGILSTPLLWVLEKSTREGFEAMNVALKKRCE